MTSSIARRRPHPEACNPNGQWAWFPDPVCRPIATALADRLENPGGPV
ncbi:hypothetical protein [Streptomyces sp. 8L]|nr:hypothetical protein [Streptomyces sp. 8L]MCA1220716.1 hypothetical protein [Streptomyces sp. 8L]